jgi:hypothetical protein
MLFVPIGNERYSYGTCGHGCDRSDLDVISEIPEYIIRDQTDNYDAYYLRYDL